VVSRLPRSAPAWLDRLSAWLEAFEVCFTHVAQRGAFRRYLLAFEERHIPLLDGVNVIGRASDVAIPIDSPGISRHHARIVVTHGEATVEDLGSKNRTRVDGTRITTPCRLSDGSEIRIGVVVLIFRIGSHLSPTETVRTGRRVRWSSELSSPSEVHTHAEHRATRICDAILHGERVGDEHFERIAPGQSPSYFLLRRKQGGGVRDLAANHCECSS